MKPQVDASHIISQDQVARFAGALEASGVVAGDRVLIYMPMIPEAAVAMLGNPDCRTLQLVNVLY